MPADDQSWDETSIDALLAPAVRALAPPTSLSPLRFDLNAGVPDRATLPAAELAEAARRALSEDPAGALTYGGAQGYEPLRAWIAARQSRETAIDLDARSVTLTSGSAHGIDNIAAAFIAPGDVVVLGAPSYPGAIRTFRARGAQIVTVPQDDDGLRMDELERVLTEQRRAGARVKLVYVIASYDNPSGSMLPESRRRALTEIARTHGVLIVEDDAYAGIDLEGRPPAPLFGLAGGRGILRLGTFSKTVATGLRVGWILGDPAIVARLVFARFDNGSSPLLHRMLLHYVQSDSYEPHLEELRALYRERRDASAAALAEHCAPHVDFRVPAGGFFHWLRLRPGLDALQVTDAAAEREVAITPGPTYFASGGGEGHVRLVYSALPPEELREGIRRLGEAIASLPSAASPSRLR